MVYLFISILQARFKPVFSTSWFELYNKHYCGIEFCIIENVYCSPDQTSQVLFDYIQQCLLGKNLPIHAVAYDTSNQLTHDTLQKLAELSSGRYHCFNSSDNREIYKVSVTRRKIKGLFSLPS